MKSEKSSMVVLQIEGVLLLHEKRPSAIKAAATTMRM
jgi:hypothetical protein